MIKTYNQAYIDRTLTLSSCQCVLCTTEQFCNLVFLPFSSFDLAELVCNASLTGSSSVVVSVTTSRYVLLFQHCTKNASASYVIFSVSSFPLYKPRTVHVPIIFQTARSMMSEVSDVPCKISLAYTQNFLICQKISLRVENQVL